MGLYEQISRLFLSTPSARRATKIRRCSMDILLISIHALCEEGDLIESPAHIGDRISIHALCEEGDSMTSSR